MITSQIENDIGTITLNHDAKRNALSERLVNAVIGALDEFTNQKVRCAVLRALPGAKVWSAGHDVSELPAGDLGPLGTQGYTNLLSLIHLSDCADRRQGSNLLRKHARVIE